MKKLIKKYGVNGGTIVLSKDDLEIHNLKVGDVVDIEIVKDGEVEEVFDAVVSPEDD
jgi:hypothetical protein